MQNSFDQGYVPGMNIQPPLEAHNNVSTQSNTIKMSKSQHEELRNLKKNYANITAGILAVNQQAGLYPMWSSSLYGEQYNNQEFDEHLLNFINAWQHPELIELNEKTILISDNEHIFGVTNNNGTFTNMQTYRYSNINDDQQMIKQIEQDNIRVAFSDKELEMVFEAYPILKNAVTGKVQID